MKANDNVIDITERLKPRKSKLDLERASEPTQFDQRLARIRDSLEKINRTMMRLRGET